MQPSAASHPEPDDLMAILDGDAAREIADHVRECGICSDQVAQYATAQGQLRQALYRFDCPSAQALGEYQLDLLEPVARTNVAAHTLECEECRVDLAELRHFLATDPPLRNQATLPAQLRRLVAGLFSPSPSLALGLRGAADSATRIYEVEHVSITVGAGSQPGALLGLVLVEDTDPALLEGREVRLVAAQGLPFVTTLDDIGNFELADVVPGLYALELHLADAIVIVEELRVD
jgi:hypothetical protein